MKIHDFSVLVSKHEGLKKQVDIGQIKEILAVVNKLLFGIPYLIIKLIPNK